MLEKTSIIQQAIQVLPLCQQADYTGVAWEWLADHADEMGDLDEQTVMSRLRNHLKYVHRKENQHHLTLTVDVPSSDGSAGADIELADELSTLDQQDRSILAMILAGSNYRETAEHVGVSPATISRAVGRLRKRYVSATTQKANHTSFEQGNIHV